jgi:hypothetical protein
MHVEEILAHVNSYTHIHAYIYTYTEGARVLWKMSLVAAKMIAQAVVARRSNAMF